MPGGWLGGGRPKGSKSKKTIELALKAAAEGLTPLEVMLKAMRTYADLDPPNWDKAAEFAKDAAPYIHPRLNAIKHSGDNNNPFAITVCGALAAKPED